jgi:hypothetical protein
VLLSVQSFDIDEIGIHRRSWGVDLPGLWVRLVRQIGMGCDESLVRLLGFGRPSGSRNLVGLYLRGRGSVRLESGTVHELDVGDVGIFPGRSAFASRVEANAAEQYSLTIEYDRDTWNMPALGSSFVRSSNPIRLTEQATAVCEAIERAWTSPADRPLVDASLGDLFSSLRADGLPLPAIELEGVTSVAPSIQRLGRAVDLALSQSQSRAMLIDVENGGAVCARTFQRILPTLCNVWGQSVESFRSHTRRSLLARAAWAMSNPAATTEIVGRAVGFSTPNAFCRAMAGYGLPSPGRVRERFAALG